MRTIFSSASVGITSDGEDPKAGGMAHDYMIDINHPPGTAAREIARVQFQHGPIREVGVNGIQHADLYRILIDRLECAQASPFACDENVRQIEHLRAALDIDEARTKRRTAAGTEGLNKGN